jgi:hypothetical protein
MDPAYLFAALVWGSIGLGFFIYGKKKKSMVHMAGGVLLMGISYLVKTPLSLSCVSLVLIAGIYLVSKRM